MTNAAGFITSVATLIASLATLIGVIRAKRQGNSIEEKVNGKLSAAVARDQQMAHVMSSAGLVVPPPPDDQERVF